MLFRSRELNYIGDTMSNKAVHITVNKTTVLTNFVIKPMITENLDATYDDFVPYDGYDIVSAGPKLLTGSVRKYAYAAYKDGTYDASTQTVTFGAEDGSGAYLSLNNYIYLKSGSQYTLSVDLEASAAITDATIGVEGKNFNKYITSLPAGKSTQSFDFTYDGNAKLSFVCYGNAANSGKTVKISNLKILRKGVTEANYGLYEETNSVHITPETKFPLYSLTSYEGNNTIISPTNFEAYTVDQYNGKALLESAKLGVEAKRDKVGLIKSEDKHIPETIKAPLMVTDAGRNLLNPTLTTVTQNGVTCTNNGDGTYTFNGTATAYTQFVIGDDSNVGVGETCKVLGLPEDANANTFYMTWMYYSTIPSKSGYIGTKKSSNGTREITFAVCSGVTLTNFVIKPMLTTDLTATYDNFVPYSGYDVKTCGKNLLDMVGKGNARYTNAGVTANRISDGSYILTGTGTTSPLNLWLSGGYQKDPLLGAPILLTLKVGHTYAIHDCTLFGYSNDVYTHFDDVIAVANYDKIITGVREKTGIVVAGSITIKPAVYDITGYIKERPEDWAFVPYVEGPTIHIDSSTQFPIMGLETMDGETNVISPASIETYHTDDENGRVLLEMIYKAANSGGIHYSADAPTGAKTGDFWIKPSSGELMYYDGSNWVLPKAGDVIGSDVVKSNTKPMHGRDVLWIDSANGNVMKHVDAAGTVTELAAGGVSVGATAPTNTKLLWIDTSSGGVSKYYNGSAWVATASVWG